MTDGYGGVKFVKKYFLVIIFVLFILVISGYLFFFHFKKNSVFEKEPEISSLNPPTIISFGTFLFWNEVEDAKEYEVYSNDCLLTTVSDTRFELGILNKETKYYVKAKNEKIISEKSNDVLASKNSEFTNDEILNLSKTATYNSTIPENVKKVILGSSTTSSTIDLCIKLERRNSDITFELHNIIIDGSISTMDSTFSRRTKNYNVIFEVYGECKIKGKNGSNGKDYSSEYFNNTEMCEAGEDGEDAIIVPTAIIKGPGNLTISGGNGGNGGIGASTTTWESSATPGVGTNGGNGGSAIKTSYLILIMDVDSSIILSDGIGGKKGIPGMNNSILTGPLVSAMWKDIYDVGKDGTRGNSIIETKLILKGNIKLT